MDRIREDKQQLQSIISAMGNTIASAMPDGWYKTVMGYFVAGENQTEHLQLHTITDTSDDYIDVVKESWDVDEYDDAIIELQKLGRQMRELCIKAYDNWNSVTFILHANGTFNMDYDYREIKEYDSRFVMSWQSQYLD